MSSEPMPKRKLAEVLAELEGLPPSETLPDIDEKLLPLDGDPLGASNAARAINTAQNLGEPPDSWQV